MAISLDSATFRTEIIQGLQNLAGEEKSIEAMVKYVQQELGFSKGFIVPVLGYFCQAFSMPLSEVLPVREWWETRNDATITSFIKQLKQWSHARK